MPGPSLAYPLYRLSWELLDWVFPPCCVGCNRPGTRWCRECRDSVKPPPEPLCPLCGMPQPHGAECGVCRENPPYFQALRSWGVFDGSLRKALHRLKYHRDIALGQSLAETMLPALVGLHWPVDMVIPIPLGKNRLRERGYNQASLIARPLALALDLEYSPGSLMRWRETHSQVGLNRAQRRENVNGVFRVEAGAARGRTILLIDDVATTGSTLSSACEVLRAAGALQVYAFTAARAISAVAA